MVLLFENAEKNGGCSFCLPLFFAADDSRRYTCTLPWKLFLGGQTAPKTGMTLHSKNKMAPHPVKKTAPRNRLSLVLFFIRSKPGLYKPHPEAPYSSSFIWVYSPSSNPSFFSAAQRTAHSLWKINRLCSRRSCTHRVPSAKRRSEMGQGECLTQ